MRLSSLQQLGQEWLIKRGHITLPVLLGVPLLVSGLGHAFFNPTTNMTLGVLELLASTLLFVGAFLASLRLVASAVACYGVAVSCVIVYLIIEIGLLIRQLGNG
jgi:hypothetical protein